MIKSLHDINAHCASQVLTILPLIVLINSTGRRLQVAQSSEVEHRRFWFQQYLVLFENFVLRHVSLEPTATHGFFWPSYDPNPHNRQVCIRYSESSHETQWSSGFRLHEIGSFHVKLPRGTEVYSEVESNPIRFSKHS